MKPEANLLRELPSVDGVLTHPAAAPLLERYSRPFVTETLRGLLDDLRQAIKSGHDLPPDRLQDEFIITDLKKKLVRASRPGMVRVVNASGTILHTNLGRALLSEAAAEAVELVARHPVNLEFDLQQGKRGQREGAIESLLRELTGAEAAAVVNNNAAAVLLGLNSMAEGKNVIVSRGELIEIGGSFRIPEVMAKSGALLREVGTTNRTHPRDYAEAVDDNTGLLLKVHTSNYRVVGFSAEVELKDLVAIGRERGVPVMEDLGSGALMDLSDLGLPREPLVGERVALGVDVVTFSGDKILGGPQAGLVAGGKSWIDRMNRNPLKRAVRCDKLTLAALEATLRSYVQSPDLLSEIPTLRAFSRPLEEIEEGGRKVLPLIRERLGPDYELELVDSTCQIGSGALPTEEIPSKGIAVRCSDLNAEQVARVFRRADPPVIGRIKNDRFILDLRSAGDPESLVPNLRSPEDRR
ncbi:MAG: L-seryl-tRNA(Sec) selenium transferase [Deltaproteobacteria bacterium]|nr:L-seryl-tRNA(Sec) selenium transferase [Deltaproteobacteria bacterium]